MFDNRNKPEAEIDQTASVTPGRVAAEANSGNPMFSANDETDEAMRKISAWLVGRLGLKEAQRALRSSMNKAALAKCSGSRRAAAVLLGVDRRYIQKLCSEDQRLAKGSV